MSPNGLRAGGAGLKRGRGLRELRGPLRGGTIGWSSLLVLGLKGAEIGAGPEGLRSEGGAKRGIVAGKAGEGLSSPAWAVGVAGAWLRERGREALRCAWSRRRRGTVGSRAWVAPADSGQTLSQAAQRP